VNEPTCTPTAESELPDNPIANRAIEAWTARLKSNPEYALRVDDQMLLRLPHTAIREILHLRNEVERLTAEVESREKEGQS
jgi:hypothetical protein